MRVICYGDSNTYGYDPRSWFGGRYPAEARWVDLLAQRAGWVTVNAGENGREIPRKPHELQRLNGILLEQPVDILVVMLGTNDLLQGASVDTITARMESFLTQIQLRGRKILLVAPPPIQIGEWVTEEQLVTESELLAERYLELAQRLDIGFADAGSWNIELAFDGVHFTEEGHRVFAHGIYKALAK